MKIRTLKGRHIPALQLNFTAGETIDLPNKVAQQLIDSGVAIKALEKKETTTKKGGAD